jgi:hypothetical protein
MPPLADAPLGLRAPAPAAAPGEADVSAGEGQFLAGLARAIGTAYTVLAVALAVIAVTWEFVSPLLAIALTGVIAVWWLLGAEKPGSDREELR